MRNTLALAAIAAAAMTLSAAQAQTLRRTAQVVTPSVSQSAAAPLGGTLEQSTPGQPRRLFSIGNLPVGIWAPQEPYYDSRNNRSLAENPLWNDPAL